MKLPNGTIYLIPTPLSGQTLEQALTQQCREIISQLDYFIVENAKSARGFLKQVGTQRPLQQLELVELNEHTQESLFNELLKPILAGRSCGLLSETGVPCLADPGSSLVALAHKLQISVVPLVGPSSILMAIIASGLCGQNFSFYGYLPAKSSEREIRVKELEKLSKLNKQSQFFIETPYRAHKLFTVLLEACNENTKISLALDLGSPQAVLNMKTVRDWKKNIPDLEGRLVVYGIESD